MDPRCSSALTTSRAQAASSTIQNTTTPPPLSPINSPTISNDGDYSGVPYGAEVSEGEFAITRVMFIGTSVLLHITDDPSDLSDVADLADASALEDLLGDPSNVLTHEQPMAADESPPPQPNPTHVGDHADTMDNSTASAVDVEQFPFGMPGAPIPGRAQDPSEYESQAMLMGSPWAPFQSQLEWEVARWAKLRGGTSTAVSELLAIPGVRAFDLLYGVSNSVVIGHRRAWPVISDGE